MAITIAPMNMEIVKAGVDYLSDQYKNNVKPNFTGFRLGDSNIGTLTSSTSSYFGNLVYTGNASKMSYGLFMNKELTLRFDLGPEIGNFNIGSFTIDIGPSIPFFVGKLTNLFAKKKTADADALIAGVSSTNQGSPGSKFTLQIRYIMMGVAGYFDLTNLTQKYAAWDRSVTLFNEVAEQPHWQPKRQIAVDTIPNESGRRAYPMIPSHDGKSWFAPPFLLPLTHASFWRVDGGEDGDNHQFIN